MSTLRTDTLQTTDSSLTIQLKDLSLKTGVPVVVNTITDLRLIDSSFVKTINLMGNATKGTGGGTYYYDPTDVTSPEDLTKGIIVGLAGARWKAVNYTGALSNLQKGITSTTDNGFELGYTSPGASVNGNGNKFNYFGINILRDKAVQQQGINGATGSKVDGLNVTLNFGGATARGGRHAIDGVLLQGFGGDGPTDSNNQDRFYVGVQGQALTDTGDGGTGPLDTRGNYFGSSSFAGVLGGSYINNLTGAEFNTQINAGGGNRVGIHTGLQVASLIGERGYNFDAALSVSNLGGSTRGWLNGLAFHGLNGSPAIEADSTVIKVYPSASSTASFDRLIDVRGLTCTALLSATNTSLTDGNLDLFKTNAFLNLGPALAASSPAVTFKSAGLGALYDSRLIATGGTSSVAAGNLQVDAGSLITPVVRPVADNTHSCGLPAFRYSVYYSNTGTINTSDAREKTDVQPLSKAELKAAKEISKEIGLYKWLSAVKDKGDDARAHVGLTVQKAVEIMEANGLDPMSYGFICYDKWDATEEVLGEDQDGSVCVVQEASPAGDRYGFRWDELSAFLIAGLEARLSALEL